MVRKPTSGDSEQREREAERARRHSKLSAGGPAPTKPSKPKRHSRDRNAPMHGAANGESAHGAIPRRGIDIESKEE